MKWVTRVAGMSFITIALYGLSIRLDPFMGGMIAVAGIFLLTLDHGGKI